MTTVNRSVAALRKLGRDRIVPFADMERHVRELFGRNDRLVAITCASMVEHALEGLLLSAMPNGAGKLFDPYQPLGTFAGKIEMAYRLGLINSDLRRNADYIREIRNVFAHRLAPTSFRTPEVAAVCKLIDVKTTDRRFSRSVRLKFAYSAFVTGRAFVAAKRKPSTETQS